MAIPPTLPTPAAPSTIPTRLPSIHRTPARRTRRTTLNLPAPLATLAQAILTLARAILTLAQATLALDLATRTLLLRTLTLKTHIPEHRPDTQILLLPTLGITLRLVTPNPCLDILSLRLNILNPSLNILSLRLDILRLLLATLSLRPAIL